MEQDNTRIEAGALPELQSIPFFLVRALFYEIWTHILTFTPTREAQRCDSVTPAAGRNAGRLQLFPFAN